MLQDDTAFAKGGDHAHLVTDEQDGSTVTLHLLHPAETFCLEIAIAYSQHLINHKDLTIEVGGYGKA
jgi:hypothetical protein